MPSFSAITTTAEVYHLPIKADTMRDHSYILSAHYTIYCTTTGFPTVFRITLGGLITSKIQSISNTSGTNVASKGGISRNGVYIALHEQRRKKILGLHKMRVNQESSFTRRHKKNSLRERTTSFQNAIHSPRSSNKRFPS